MPPKAFPMLEQLLPGLDTGCHKSHGTTTASSKLRHENAAPGNGIQVKPRQLCAHRVWHAQRPPFLGAVGDTPSLHHPSRWHRNATVTGPADPQAGDILRSAAGTRDSEQWERRLPRHRLSRQAVAAGSRRQGERDRKDKTNHNSSEVVSKKEIAGELNHKTELHKTRWISAYPSDGKLSSLPTNTCPVESPKERNEHSPLVGVNWKGVV